MRNYLFFVTLVLAAGLSLVIAQPAEAQNSGYPYRPSKPVLSPYFNYSRRDTASLPAYFAFVRPQQDEMAYKSYVRSEFRRENRRLSDLSRQIQLRQQAGNVTPGPGLQLRFQSAEIEPSRAASFLDYSGYYPPPPAPRRR
jgi:hypothetical protein